MRHTSFCVFLLTSLLCMAQQEISFEELHETYDTTANHEFLHYVYKNLTFPDEYGQKDTVRSLTITYSDDRYKVQLHGNTGSEIDAYLETMIDSATQYLIAPDKDFSTSLEIRYKYIIGNDKVENDKKDGQIVITRFEPISCGPAPR